MPLVNCVSHVKSEDTYSRPARNWNKKLGSPGPTSSPAPLLSETVANFLWLPTSPAAIHKSNCGNLYPRSTPANQSVQPLNQKLTFLFPSSSQVGATSMLGALFIFILHNSTKVEQQSFDLIRWHFSVPWNGDLVCRPFSLSSSSHFSLVSRICSNF